jgi:sortase (surface protein transpeptidase)
LPPAFDDTRTLVLDRAAQTRAVQAVVALDGGTSVRVSSKAGGNFVLDLVGWYSGSGDAASTDGLFIPSDPKRRFDSRTRTYLAPWPRTTYEVDVDEPIAAVSAVVMNLAVLQPWDNGFFTAYPAGATRPNTSALNTSAWPQTIAGHVVARISNRGMALYTSAGAHMVVDVTGYFTGTAATAIAAPLPLPDYDPTTAIAVSVPKLKVFLPIAVARTTAGLTTLADRGFAAAWSTNVLTPVAGNVMLFGHRTSGSAPFRYLNNLKFGDLITLIGSDGHQYHYKAVQTAVTAPLFASVNAVAGKYPPITVQLVACSRADGSATSLNYRISVTARLVGMT